MRRSRTTASWPSSSAPRWPGPRKRRRPTRPSRRRRPPRRRTDAARGTEDPSKPLAFREEVVVTAQKRTEAIEDIPASVTVVGGQLLEQQRADDFQDLVPLVPGLSVTTTRPGATRITLRGINTDGVASTIGVYFDDVPFGSSSGLANAAIVVRRLRHVRHREGRGAARPARHPVRSELARRRHQVRSEPAQHREVRGAGSWEARRPSTTATPGTP